MSDLNRLEKAEIAAILKANKDKSANTAAVQYVLKYGYVDTLKRLKDLIKENKQNINLTSYFEFMHKSMVQNKTDLLDIEMANTRLINNLG